MKVVEFEEKNKISHFPIDIVYDKKNRIKEIKYCHSFKDFRELSDDLLAARNNRTTALMAGDTYNVQRIDVDDIESFKQVFDMDLLGNTPHYMSRNKRLPHYFIKLVNYDGNKDRLTIKQGKTTVCDLLNGQWAWYKTSETIVNGDKPIVEVDYDKIRHLFEKPKKEKKKKKVLNIEKTVDSYYSDDKHIKEILDCLSTDRFNYDDWLNVGIALYNTNPNYFNLWDDWSKKSDAYNYDELLKKWDSFKYCKNKLTIGSLKYWAKQDNPEQYENIIAEKYFLNLSSGDDGTAKAFYYLFNDRLVCASESPNIWFQYNNGMWHKMKGVSYIRKLYANEFCKWILKQQQLFQTKINNMSNEDEKAKLNNMMSFVGFWIQTCKIYKHVTDKIKQSIYLFLDTEFTNKLNSNPNLLCFGENVYDLKSCLWRPTEKDDYCSISVGYDKKDVLKADTLEIEGILHDMFQDPLEYQYFLNNLTELLYGQNKREIFNVWLGVGANGKSLLATYLKHVFGDYYSTMQVAMLTSKRPSATQANPELAKARYSRIVMFSEPEANEKLNNSYMKELTGGDSISTRELYGNQFDYIPQFTPIILCNELELQNINDDSMPRRLILCKFKTNFVKHEPKFDYEKPRDDTLKSTETIDRIKLGFMKLLLENWTNIYKMDFKYDIPESMIFDKLEFLDDNNILKMFVDEYIMKTNDKNDYITLSDVYEKFKAFAKDNGEAHVKKKHLKARIQKFLPEFKKRKKINGADLRSIFIYCKFADELEVAIDDDLY
jgi:P4 family phage/plasmid primase-like protien